MQEEKGLSEWEREGHFGAPPTSLMLFLGWKLILISQWERFYYHLFDRKGYWGSERWSCRFRLKKLEGGSPGIGHPAHPTHCNCLIPKSKARIICCFLYISFVKCPLLEVCLLKYWSILSPSIHILSLLTSILPYLGKKKSLLFLQAQGMHIRQVPHLIIQGSLTPNN